MSLATDLLDQVASGATRRVARDSSSGSARQSRTRDGRTLVRDERGTCSASICAALTEMRCCGTSQERSSFCSKANNGIDVEVTTLNRVDAFPTPKPAEDQYLLSASGL